MNEMAHATVSDLLAALDHDDAKDCDAGELIEDYVLGYLDEDLGMGLFVELGEGDDGEELSLRARLSFDAPETVDMWILELPVTTDDFHRYLDELDVRVARMRILIELPTTNDRSDSDDDMNEVSILGVVSRLFGSSEDEVIAELGVNWRPISSDVMGTSSKPDRYLLWDDRLIVGLDDQYGPLYLPATTHDEVVVGDEITWFELGEDQTIGVTEFARALRGTLGTEE